MTDSNGHWLGSIFRILCALGLTVHLLQAPAAAQTNGVAAAKETLSRLNQFSNDVRNLREVASRRLGPYPISIRCTWCDYAWGALCWTEKTATVSSSIDFTWTRSQLQNVLRNVENDTSTFSQSYKPTQAWIDGLPDFSRKFDVAADRVLGVQADIKAGKVPSDQQRDIVKQALQELATDLSNSSGALRSGTQALAAALQRQSEYASSIQQAIAGADHSAQVSLGQYQQQTQSYPCQDQFRGRFNDIKGDFARSVEAISAAFRQVDISSRQAQQGIAELLGAVVSSQTDLQSVIDGVKAATNDQLGSFLERLHLSAAKKRWEDLASAAGNLPKKVN